MKKPSRSSALALSLTLAAAALYAGPATQAQTAGSSAGQSAHAPASLPSIDKLVIMTCRQAWQAGGRDQEGFFAIVKQLAELSAQNRGVTLPDDKEAGARAGQWIRTQALKDPDQLLYAVVDHALLYSITKGRATPVAGSATPPAR
ncbi:hypothetical protein [Acidipila sp. EB88]|uniref:hypothetical protein n=1 Tax=Acidipila sp. EB88 TaxID=2305226 RepID=UPI000F5DC9F6|nr:hypothetical protein [Acidipila sp. EB88]RRA48840.1 hypothetical protein D1Y84_11630 [Acidipila sp. EB88]